MSSCSTKGDRLAGQSGRVLHSDNEVLHDFMFASPSSNNCGTLPYRNNSPFVCQFYLKSYIFAKLFQKEFVLKEKLPKAEFLGSEIKKTPNNAQVAKLVDAPA